MKIANLPSSVVGFIRARGHTDEAIEKMSVEQLFTEYCEYGGLTGLGPTLLNVARSLDAAAASEDEALELVELVEIKNDRTILYVLAEGQPGEEEDSDVPGRYMLVVDDMNPEDMVSAALDCFHESVPIGLLDPFRFQVVDGTGKQLNEPEKADAYRLGHRASFHGKVIDVEYVEVSALVVA